MSTNSTTDTAFEEVHLVECPICNELHSSVAKAESCYISCATKRGRERATYVAGLTNADDCLSAVKKALKYTTTPDLLLSVRDIGEYITKLFKTISIPLVVSVEAVDRKGFSDKLTLQKTLPSFAKVDFDVKLKVCGSFNPKVAKVAGMELIKEKLDITLLPYYDEVDQYGSKPISLKFPLYSMLKEICASKDMAIAEPKLSKASALETQSVELEVRMRIGCASKLKEIEFMKESLNEVVDSYTSVMDEVKELEAQFKTDVETFLSKSPAVQKLPDLDAEIAQLQQMLAQKLQDKKAVLKGIGESLIPMQQAVSAKVNDLTSPLNTQLRNLNVAQPMLSPPALGYGALAEYLPYAHALLRL